MSLMGESKIFKNSLFFRKKTWEIHGFLVFPDFLSFPQIIPMTPRCKCGASDSSEIQDLAG
jgi:hypothetical protein